MNKLFYFVLAICFFAVSAYAQTNTLLIDGIARMYIVHVPSSYNGSTTVPLLIAIHNAYGTASSFETLTGFSAKADSEGFIVAYPEGTGNPTCWNAGKCCFSAVTGRVNDIGFISAIIDTLQDLYNIDPARIYAAGFSNGSMMSYRAAAELSTKIAAIGAVAGQMVLSSFNPDQPVAIIEFHTLDDTSVPYNGDAMFPAVEDVIGQWCYNNSCGMGADTILNVGGILGRKWESTNADADIVLYRLNSGGHSWPASSVSATNLIWDFFESHPKQSVTDVSQDSRSLKPDIYCLKQNYPNPFNPETVISYKLFVSSKVNLKVFDMLGREITTLVDENKSSGEYTVKWNAENCPSGVYFCKLRTNDFEQTIKLNLIR